MHLDDPLIRPVALPAALRALSSFAGGRALPLRAMGSVGVGLLVLAGLILGGAVRSEQDLLVFIGFDPDRSALISALSIGAVAAFTAGLLTGQRRLPALLGIAALMAIFGGTFLVETQTALQAAVGQVAFDGLGWMISVVAIVVASVVVGWAAATLAAHARASLLQTAQETRRRVRASGPRGLANRRLGLTLAAASMLAVSGSVIPSMINYSPDTLFRPGNLGLGLAPAGPGGSPDPGGVPAGRIERTQLPAPWTGGTATETTVSVYVPAGYRSGSARYPVVYSVPWGFPYWQDGIHIKEMLDGLIARKTIPPTIVVFAGLSSGGPFPDTECADSADGRQHVETFLSRTLPAWLDGKYRTLASAENRTLFGFSQGGFCSTMLLLRHPDVFHYAISFGGYYEAGIKAPQTVNAALPWGADAELMSTHSPMALASTLPAAIRAQLFIVLSGSATQPFYGAQYSAFVNELATDGIPSTTFETPAAHSWPSVQSDLPLALKAVAQTQAERLRALGATPTP